MSSVTSQFDRRACQRIYLNRKMLLALDSGIQLQAETIDISLRGVLLLVASTEPDLAAGQSGQLHIIFPDNTRSPGFACEVIRVSPSGIAIELEKKVAPIFGKQLTRDMFVHP
ncbi:MAG: PilZ domain-containing protein [Gammaproteobacteria bacterium]|nr:PilZ domain-containing protein [Gammaproteobacteria bacterium]